MAMKHSIYDTDPHFFIDPIARTLKCDTSKKTCLIQNDHNSERFTFEIPRHIEGHDMLQCNVVQVHYLNVDAQTKAQSRGVYEVDDLQAAEVAEGEEEVVIGSWLLSQAATMYAGSLSFLLRFSCVDENGVIQYVWNTGINTGITVSGGIYNGEAIVEQYADILKTWYNDLVNGGETSVQSIEEAKAGALQDIDTAKTNALEEIDAIMGDMDAALDSIIAIQEELIGGEA